MLHPRIFYLACETLQYEPSIDLFADNATNQCPRFLSARPSEGTCGVNAFNYRWAEESGYANPPWSLLPRVLRKVCIEPCVIMLVFPEWPNAWWYPAARQLSVATFLWTEPCYISGISHLRPKPKWNTRFAILDGSQASEETLALLHVRRPPPVVPTMSITQMLQSATTDRNHQPVSQLKRPSSENSPRHPALPGRSGSRWTPRRAHRSRSHRLPSRTQTLTT